MSLDSVRQVSPTRFYRTYKELKLGAFAACKNDYSGFYRTYKELKHPWIFMKGKRINKSFYRTYKELKPVWERNNQWELQRFYRTYKELKHQYISNNDIEYIVFIVPIRN